MSRRSGARRGVRQFRRDDRGLRRLRSTDRLEHQRHMLRLGDLLRRHLGLDELTVRDGKRVASGGRQIEPHMRADEVLLDAVAGGVKDPERMLGVRVALVGRLAAPAQRLGVIFGHALPFHIHRSELGLRLGLSLIRGLSQPGRALRRVLRYALALDIHGAEIILGLRDALFGQWAQYLGGPRIILPLIGCRAILERPGKRLAGHGERAGHQQGQERQSHKRLHEDSANSRPSNSSIAQAWVEIRGWRKVFCILSLRRKSGLGATV